MKFVFEDGLWDCLIFQPLFRSLKTPSGSDRSLTWKSGRFSEENIKPPDISNDSIAPKSI